MHRVLKVTAAALAGFAVAAMTGLATAKTHHSTIKTTHNSKFGTILAGSTGRTLYELHPETSHHLLCKSSQCLQFWPPLKVKSAKNMAKPANVKGKLGVLHRHGFLQATLNGHPLYYFAEDSAPGDANGDGVHGFGGIWHVVHNGSSSGDPAQSTSTSGTSTPSTTSTSMTTTTTPYVY